MKTEVKPEPAVVGVKTEVKPEPAVSGGGAAAGAGAAATKDDGSDGGSDGGEDDDGEEDVPFINRGDDPVLGSVLLDCLGMVVRKLRYHGWDVFQRGDVWEGAQCVALLWESLQL